MSLFRGCLAVKIKEGSFDDFKSHIPVFVQKMEETEPTAQQMEAFANEQTNEIIWLESYPDNSGFDFHIGNPALNEVKQQMMPLQEAILDMYFLSAPTPAALQGLQQYGINPTVLTPWPGTVRLTESRNEATNIQVLITMDLSDMATYRGISDSIEAIASTQGGVLFHRSYQIDDHRVFVLEEHYSSDSLLAWAKATASLSQQLGRIVSGMKVRVCGNPSPEAKTFLDGWGASYYHQVAGFKHFH